MVKFPTDIHRKFVFSDRIWSYPSKNCLTKIGPFSVVIEKDVSNPLYYKPDNSSWLSVSLYRLLWLIVWDQLIMMSKGIYIYKKPRIAHTFASPFLTVQSLLAVQILVVLLFLLTLYIIFVGQIDFNVFFCVNCYDNHHSFIPAVHNSCDHACISCTIAGILRSSWSFRSDMKAIQVLVVRLNSKYLDGTIVLYYTWIVFLKGTTM